MVSEAIPGQQIPVPDNFKFEWDTPEEAASFWTADLMHWPNGISPLAGTMDVPPFGRGMLKAAQELSMPFKGVGFKMINNYLYNRFEPYSYDPEEMEKRLEEMKARMMGHIPGLLDRWRNEYEPEAVAINQDTLLGDYSKLGDRDLADLFEQIVAKREREGELHFLAVFPAFGGVMAFEEVYTKLFGEPKGGEHLLLLQGFPNKSTETDTALWHVAQEAKKRPEVLRAIHSTLPAQVHEALKSAEGGEAMRGAVTEYTSKYGWRAAELDIAYKTWAEDPAPVYQLIRRYAEDNGYNPEEEFRSLVTAREAREKVLMADIPAEQQGMFEGMLRMAQQYLPIQEDHNFWIDQQGTSVERVPALEAGRRLANAGRIESEDDVFCLEFEEMLDALRGVKGDISELVKERRELWDHYKRMDPPPAVGTVPPVLDTDNPSLTKFFGAPPPPNPDPRVMNGNAASQGTVTGTARVVLSLEDSGRLQNGDILVCPATMPPWTPLFGIASAVVTDHGGILSHTAIVAREYRIPAVVGTKVGTRLIRDGQQITVDGTNGTVKLEE
jgi:pyruvate,water dikinase